MFSQACNHHHHHHHIPSPVEKQLSIIHPATTPLHDTHTPAAPRFKGPGGVDLTDMPDPYPIYHAHPLTPSLCEPLFDTSSCTSVTSSIIHHQPATLETHARKPSTSMNKTTSEKRAGHLCTWPGCKREFKKMCLLRSHYLTHTETRPYSCAVCSAAFVRNHDKRRHERTVHRDTLAAEVGKRSESPCKDCGGHTDALMRSLSPCCVRC
ncbi:hypothetical protein BJ741DRAFT_31734 [Chytriomyces cf. hyalinus JEL632]|nr:hypothetical protein BJ741DRAFT_31734 [Chytriomyces cf. hyalinus JEL632]